MKRSIVPTLLAGVLMFSGGVIAASGIAQNPRIESAVVTFNEPARLQEVILHGTYLFIHHEGMMARGKPCTSVYIVDGEKDGRFVTSFHCRSVKRHKAEQFKVITSQAMAGEPPVIQEIQFAGQHRRSPGSVATGIQPFQILQSDIKAQRNQNSAQAAGGDNYAKR